MATTLRELTEKATQNIKHLKLQTGIKTDNKAIILMLEQHSQIESLKCELRDTKSILNERLQTANNKITKYKSAVINYIHYSNALKEIADL